MRRKSHLDLQQILLSRWFQAIGAFTIGLVMTFTSSEVYAVPSFARQTGMPCTGCHTAFPQLNPFGRAFKLSGYTMSDEQSTLPPLAMMLQGAPGFTHTESRQPRADVPRGFSRNDNLSLNQMSFFYAGRLFGPYANWFAGKSLAGILNSIGVFVQGTYDGVAKQWAWDNVEIRAAHSTTIAGTDVTFGGYINNNPTMQDLWNTVPAWGFPFADSNLAPAPAAAPLIAGGLSQQVFGFGAYSMINHLLYLDVGAYRSLAPSVQRSLGVDPTGETELDDFAPYWRLALEKNEGVHSLEFGTFGLATRTFPGRVRTAGHDTITDVGLDTQYQYLGTPHDVTILANWIYETQRLHASHQLGNADNVSNNLWTASLTGSYLYDKTYGVDIQYAPTGGKKDVTLYGPRTGRPTSDRWVFELDYLPFNKMGGPRFWPASNLKISLEYALYTQFNGAHHNFDGSGRNASDNNTLYLSAWIDF